MVERTQGTSTARHVHRTCPAVATAREWRFHPNIIKASADPGESDDSAFWQAGHMAKESPMWNYHEISTSHSVPMTRPDELAAILLDLITD